MRREAVLIALGLAGVLGGCSSGDGREWMKISEKYTTEEFRRDYAECSRGGKLDEECMKRRGWVAVTAPKQEDKPFSDPTGGGTPGPAPGTDHGAARRHLRLRRRDLEHGLGLGSGPRGGARPARGEPPRDPLRRRRVAPRGARAR